MVGTGIPVTSGTNLMELAKTGVKITHCYLEVLCGCSRTIHKGLIDYEVINNFQVLFPSVLVMKMLGQTHVIAIYVCCI